MKKALRKTQTLKHCALAVVRRSQNFFAPPGTQNGKNLSSWRWSTYLHLQTQFGEDRCSQFRVIVVTDPHTYKHAHKHTHKQTHRQDRFQCTVPLIKAFRTAVHHGRSKRSTSASTVSSCFR